MTSVLKHGKIALLLGLLLQSSQAAYSITTVADGPWTTPATWGGTLPVATDDVKITHNVTLSSTVTVNDLLITTGGLSHTAGSLTVTGDFSLAGGGYTSTTTGTVNFTGTGLQTIDGSPTFGNITIANTAATPSDTAAVVTSGGITTLAVSINDGQFSPDDGSNIRNIYIAADGILKPITNATVYVTGDNGFGSAFTNNNGVFEHNNSTFTFNASTLQRIYGLPSSYDLAFFNVIVDNGAVTPDDANAFEFYLSNSSVDGTLTVNDGQVTLRNDFNDIIINSDGIAEIVSTSSIEVFGDFTLAGGSFDANGRTTTFAGSGLQTISGSPTFANVTILNTAATPDDVNAVTSAGGVGFGNVTISDGQFMPGDGDSINAVSITANGILKPALNAQITVPGDTGSGYAFINNSGDFEHNNSTFTFNSSTLQRIYGLPTSYDLAFFNVIVDNGTVTPGDGNALEFYIPNSSVDGTLTVNDGMALLYNDFENVVINPNGIVKLGGSIDVFKDWTFAGGSFDPNGRTVSFVGDGPQAITGSGIFGNVEIVNTALTPDDGNAVTSAGGVGFGNVTISDGQFMPGDGDSINAFSMTANGILKPALNAQITVTGDTGSGSAFFNNSGIFEHNNSTFTFNSSTPQRIGGLPSSYDLAFFNVIVDNGAVTPDDANAFEFFLANSSVDGTLTVNDGMALLRNDFENVVINPNGIVKLEGSIDVFKDWTFAGGTFDPSGRTVSFVGDGPQAITGSGIFGDVEIENTAPTPDDANAVTSAGGIGFGIVTVSDGQFMPGDGDTIAYAFIAANGILKPVTGAEITFAGVSGGDYAFFNSNGTFVHNSGHLVFAGSTLQRIGSITALTLNDVTIANTAAIPDDSNAVEFYLPNSSVEGTLTVNDGMALLRNDFKDVVVGVNGVAKLKYTASFSGNLTNNGSFLANNANATFNGDGPQTIDGAVSFDFLTIQNTSPSPSDLNAVLTTQSTVVNTTATILDGQFTPLSGSQINELVTSTGGIFKMPPASTLTVLGDILNQGTVDVQTTDVTFNGGIVQTVAGTSPIVAGSITVDSGTTLNEVGATALLSGPVTNNGTIRRTWSLAGPGVYTPGLAGSTVEVVAEGTATEIYAERIESVPNAAADHLESISWTYTADGTGYEVNVTLPHSMANANDSAVSRYLGSGTNWEYSQDAFTASSVTRNGVTDLTSVWAAADHPGADVPQWIQLD